ncbi:O-antigen translocase [Pseudomonas asplenii]|uniref:O-antigen translocase n=1 Tax=Pseudomonas asplenii TaxID=53407 RepID=UPI0037C6AC31
MKLIKTSLLSGVASLIKIFTLLGINKVLAIYTGPSGYALVGQLQNAVQIFSTFASGAISTGVTKYTAEYGGASDRQEKLWRTAFGIAISGSVVSAIVLIVFSAQLSEFFLGDRKYSSLFIIFAIGLCPMVVNTLLLAILNGKKEIKGYVLANIVGSLFSLLFTVVLAYFFDFYGALVALVSYQSVACLFTLAVCLKTNWFRVGLFLFKFDRQATKELAKYTFMALCSAVCVPLSALFIRTYLTNGMGVEAAGYWEAMNRLSSAYMMVVTMTLSVYYLPKLSELASSGEIKQEVLSGYKIILPIAALLSLVVFVLRDFIIWLLFSSDFSPMRPLFVWQLVGDTLKIGSWILSYLMVSRAMIKEFIISEVLFSITLCVLVVVFSNLYGLIGATIGYSVNYFAYWVFLYFFVWRKV